jgi:hypothetical protein
MEESLLPLFKNGQIPGDTEFVEVTIPVAVKVQVQQRDNDEEDENTNMQKGGVRSRPPQRSNPLYSRKRAIAGILKNTKTRRNRQLVSALGTSFYKKKREKEEDFKQIATTLLKKQEAQARAAWEAEQGRLAAEAQERAAEVKAPFEMKLYELNQYYKNFQDNVAQYSQQNTNMAAGGGGGGGQPPEELDQSKINYIHGLFQNINRLYSEIENLYNKLPDEKKKLVNPFISSAWQILNDANQIILQLPAPVAQEPAAAGGGGGMEDDDYDFVEVEDNEDIPKKIQAQPKPALAPELAVARDDGAAMPKNAKNDWELIVRTIPKSTYLYHAGQRINDAKERLFTPEASCTHNEDFLPHFFSNKYVAALYANPENPYSYTYEVNMPLRLLEVNEVFCDYIWELYVNNIFPAIRPILGQFIITFGYSREGIPDDVKKQFRQRAEEILQNFKYIKLSSTYPIPNKINRISTSNNDFAMFSSMMTILPQILPAAGLIHGFYMPPHNSGMWNMTNLVQLDGIFPEEVYVSYEATDAELQKLLILQQKVGQGFKCGYNLFPAGKLEKAEAACFYKTNVMSPGAPSTMPTGVTFAERYISMVNYRYTQCVNKILADNYFGITIPESSYRIQYKIIGDFIKQLLGDIQQHTFKNMAKVLHEFYRMDSRLYENMPINGFTSPFGGEVNDVKGRTRLQKKAEGGVAAAGGGGGVAAVAPTFAPFNENLFIFTILNNVLKSTVAGLNDILVHAMNYTRNNIDTFRSKYPAFPFDISESDSVTSFNAVVSGGALFGLYTHGTARRQTKDMDVKIVLTTDEEKNANPLIVQENGGFSPLFWKMELYHMISMYITFYWQKITFNLYELLTTSKMNWFKESLKTIENVYELPKSHQDTSIVYSPAVGRSPTYISIIEFGLNEYFQKKWPAESNLLTQFNTYIQKQSKTDSPLEYKNYTFVEVEREKGKRKSKSGILEENTVPITSYKEFVLARLHLLSEKRKLKLASEGVNNTITEEQKEEYRRIINQSIKNISGLFITWYTATFEADAEKMSLLRLYDKDLPNLVANRPYVEFDKDLKYGISYFSSLYINSTHSANASYGVIDYTFDTYFNTIGSYQKFSGLLDNLYNNLNGAESDEGLLYASGYHFIYESNKLSVICNRSYFMDAEFIEENVNNPFNNCSPDLHKRREKQIKYNDRAIRVLTYIQKEWTKLQDQVPALNNLPQPVNLDSLIQAFNAMADKDIQIRNFTKALIEVAREGRIEGREYFIGGRRHTRTRVAHMRSVKQTAKCKKPTSSQRKTRSKRRGNN